MRQQRRRCGCLAIGRGVFFCIPWKNLTAESHPKNDGFFQEESRCSRYFQVLNTLAFGGRLLGWCFETNLISILGKMIPTFHEHIFSDGWQKTTNQLRQQIEISGFLTATMMNCVTRGTFLIVFLWSA